MDIELNRLRTFYLLSNGATPYQKHVFAKYGHYMNFFKERVICRFCGSNNELNQSLDSILSEHKRCCKCFGDKKNFKIKSPYTTTVDLDSLSDILFEEFRIATFRKLKKNGVHDDMFACKLAQDGYYFHREPNTIKCAYCAIILSNSHGFHYKTCLIKRNFMNNKIKKLNFGFIEKNWKRMTEDEAGPTEEEKLRKKAKDKLKTEAMISIFGSNYSEATYSYDSGGHVSQNDDGNNRVARSKTGYNCLEYMREAYAMGLDQSLVVYFVKFSRPDCEREEPFEDLSNFLIRYFDYWEDVFYTTLEKKNESTCIICDDVLEVAMMCRPCDHATACLQCSESLVKCPLCNQIIKFKHRYVL